MISKETSAIFVLKLFECLKRIIEKSVWITGKSIVHQRRMVKSTYLVFWKAGLLRQFCSEELLQISKKNTFQQKDFVREKGKELEKYDPFILGIF